MGGAVPPLKRSWPGPGDGPGRSASARGIARPAQATQARKAGDMLAHAPRAGSTGGYDGSVPHSGVELRFRKGAASGPDRQNRRYPHRTTARRLRIRYAGLRFRSEAKSTRRTRVARCRHSRVHCQVCVYQFRVSVGRFPAADIGAPGRIDCGRYAALPPAAVASHRARLRLG